MVNDQPLATGTPEATRDTRAAAFFDVDGTLVPGQAIWRGIWRYHFAMRRRRLLAVRFFLSNMGRYALYRSGLMPRDRFIAGWGERLALLFRDLTPQQAEEMITWVWEHSLRPALHMEVVSRLREHQQAGHYVVLVSATLHGLLEVLARELGADEVFGSRLEVSAGRYTGKMAPPLCFGPHKAARIRDLIVARPELDLAASYAYADSGHDAPVLDLVGHPTAVHPDPALLAMARERAWPVLGAPQK